MILTAIIDFKVTPTLHNRLKPNLNPQTSKIDRKQIILENVYAKQQQPQKLILPKSVFFRAGLIFPEVVQCTLPETASTWRRIYYSPKQPQLLKKRTLVSHGIPNNYDFVDFTPSS